MRKSFISLPLLTVPPSLYLLKGLMTQERRLVKQGHMCYYRKKNSSKYVYLFLFNDMVLVANPRKKNDYKYVDHYPITYVKFESLEDTLGEMMRPPLPLLEEWKINVLTSIFPELQNAFRLEEGKKEHIFFTPKPAEKLGWQQAFTDTLRKAGHKQ